MTSKIIVEASLEHDCLVLVSYKRYDGTMETVVTRGTSQPFFIHEGLVLSVEEKLKSPEQR